MSYIASAAAAYSSAMLTADHISDVWELETTSIPRKHVVARLMDGAFRCSEHRGESKCECIRRVVVCINDEVGMPSHHMSNHLHMFSHGIISHHRAQKNPHPFPTLEELDGPKKTVKKAPKGRKIIL
jgi:hypothetical protein